MILKLVFYMMLLISISINTEKSRHGLRARWLKSTSLPKQPSLSVTPHKPYISGGSLNYIQKSRLVSFRVLGPVPFSTKPPILLFFVPSPDPEGSSHETTPIPTLYLVFLASGRYALSSTPSTTLTIFSISLLCFSHWAWDMFSCLSNMLGSGLRYEPPMRSQRVVYWP